MAEEININVAAEPEPDEEGGEGEDEGGEAWEPLLTGISQQYAEILGEIRTVAENSRNSSQVTETLLAANRDLTAQLQTQAATLTEALGRLIPQPLPPISEGEGVPLVVEESIALPSETPNELPEKQNEEKNPEPPPRKRRSI
jgi:hypothetical protein